MDAYVIVATKGRASEVRELLNWLSDQKLEPRSVVIVGAESSDVAGLETHPYALSNKLTVLVTQAVGLCIQRNEGVNHMLASDGLRETAAGFFVAFFDDDFRPARDWLERCRDAFLAQPNVAALTGQVLADGVPGGALTSAQAQAYIDGRIAAVRHWASGERQRDLTSMYGCNMAFRDTVVRCCRFDENLPLYGWQEDQDYTGQARAYGRTVYSGMQRRTSREQIGPCFRYSLRLLPNCESLVPDPQRHHVCWQRYFLRGASLGCKQRKKPPLWTIPDA